jgi:hypothetical protein
MNTEHYKASSERTDSDERALIPGFKRTKTSAITGETIPAWSLRENVRTIPAEKPTAIQTSQPYNEEAIEAINDALYAPTDYKAHADKLAEALRIASMYIYANHTLETNGHARRVYEKTREALDAYELSK